MKSTIRPIQAILTLLILVIFSTSCSNQDELQTKAITTVDANSISVNSARIETFLTGFSASEVTRCGVCWSLNASPTLTDSVTDGVLYKDQFFITLSNLRPGSTYQIKAFVQLGQEVVYGPERSFKTAEIPDIEMKNIAGGTFQMGNTLIPTESPVHAVTLSAFSMSATEISQSAWTAIMGSNPSSFKESMRPVEYVSYVEILEFISILNQVSGNSYRLPTEAEWEFAAKGGADTTTIWSGTSIADSLVNFGWFASGSNNQTHAVATKRPNKLGLYDMSGNVWEFCSDHYESYTSSAQTNPTGPVSSQDMFVIRGGAWNSDGSLCKKSSRSFNYRYDRKYTTGFRLAM